MTDARSLTTALGGRWHGRYGAAPCPACQSERRRDQNGLTLADGRNGRLVLDCKKSGCAFLDILAAAGLRSGDYTPPDAATLAHREREAKAETQRKAAQAKRVWQEAQPIAGTLAETYLRGRGITCDLPTSLQFHPECWHGPTAKRHPAMIAMVEGSDGFAVHRTYLRADGGGKAGLDGSDKLMLGAVTGGAIRLTQWQGPLLTGEGIESTLSAYILLDDPTVTAWAALSANGVRGLRLPRTPGEMIVAVDGETAGREAGRALAQRATAAGWRVRIADPGNGLDFNDLLQREGVA